MALPQLPNAARLGSLLAGQSPPTQAPVKTSVLPGNLILDRATIQSVNNTDAIVGSGPTTNAPFTCQVLYQNTVYYSVAWISIDGSGVPAVGQAMVLAQPPLLYVIGVPSNWPPAS